MRREYIALVEAKNGGQCGLAHASLLARKPEWLTCDIE